MKISKLTPADWVAMLDQSAPKTGMTKKNYLAVQKNIKTIGEASVEAVAADAFNEKNYTTLTLREITYISRSVLETEPNKEQPKEKIRIALAVDSIADSKIGQLKKMRVKRGFLRALSYLCFASIIGIGIGMMIKDRLDEPEKEIKIAKEFVSKIKLSDPEKFAIAAKNLQYIALVETEIPKQTSDVILGELKSKILTRSGQPKEMLESEFILDNGRLFIATKIEDRLGGQEKPHISLGHGKEEGVNEYCKKEHAAFDSIFTRSPGDEKWLPILLIILGQVTVSGFLDNLKFACNAMDWKTGENRQIYNPKTDISVNIVRPGEGQPISALEVTATATPLLYYKPADQLAPPINFDEENVIGRIQSKLKFTITLNSKNEPETSIQEYHHELLKGNPPQNTLDGS